MKRLLVALATLVVCVTAQGADVPINGATTPVPANSFAELSVKIEKGDMASWTVYPVPVKKVDLGDGKLYFSGPPGQKYVVSVVVVNFEQKRFDTGQANVEFAGSPQPPPPSPDEPPTPEQAVQDKELNKAIEAAIPNVSEADAAWLPNLQLVYDKAARKKGFVDKATTWGSLFEAMKKEADLQQVSGKMTSVQSVIQAYLKKNLPWQGASDTPLTATDKAKAKTAFQKVSTAIYLAGGE